MCAFRIEMRPPPNGGTTLLFQPTRLVAAVADSLAGMSAKQHSRCCPACGHRFIPWRVWQISRWTCIRCPSCGVRLSRRFDRQFYWIGCVICLVLAAIPFLDALGWQIAVGAFGMLLVTLADAATVRLVEAGRRRTQNGVSFNNRH